MTLGPLRTLHGLNGQLELHADKVIIRRTGAAKKGQGAFKGDKSIFLQQIKGIQVKQGGFMTDGYILFLLPGGSANSRDLLDATRNENAVTFHKSQNVLVNEIKALIESRLARRPSLTAPSPSKADELRKSKQLLDEGVLTQEEFDKLKRDILET